MRDWRPLYKAVLREEDPRILERLVAETENAICLRLRQLPKHTHEQKERSEVREAAKTLLIFKRERLNGQ